MDININTFYIIVIIIVLIEYDRLENSPVRWQAYYFERPMRPLLGMYNNLLRPLSIFHAPIMHNIDSYFKAHILLKNRWKEIAKEAINIYKNYNLLGFNESTGGVDFDEIDSDDKWKVFVLKWYDDIITQSKEKAPLTCSIINSIPNIKSAMFSILLPGKIIPKHKGPFKGILRYHLGLSIPYDRKNCFISVDDEKYHWENGGDILFDDTYEHYVVNNTKQIRIILFCDVLRPIIEPFYTINSKLIDTGPFHNFIKTVNDNSEKPLSSNLANNYK